jgi:hypothetical protein
MLQQTLVSLDLVRYFGKEQFDRATPIGCRQDFLYELLHEWSQLQWRGLEFNLARIKTPDEQR